MTIKERAEKIIKELAAEGFSVSDALKILGEADGRIRVAGSKLFQEQRKAPLSELLRRASNYCRSGITPALFIIVDEGKSRKIF